VFTNLKLVQRMANHFASEAVFWCKVAATRNGLNIND
jgi:hypothetical protein